MDRYTGTYKPKKIYLFLNTIDKVKRYVSIVSDCNIPLYIKSGRFVIDGKSILGIFSLNLSEPLELRFDIKSDEDLEIANYYLNLIAEFFVDVSTE